MLNMSECRVMGGIPGADRQVSGDGIGMPGHEVVGERWEYVRQVPTWFTGLRWTNIMPRESTFRYSYIFSL